MDFAARAELMNHAFYRADDAAWPFSMLFMVVIGAVVASKKGWHGWRRWIPLTCGLGLPLMMLTMFVAGRHAASMLFGFYTAIAWALLGYAVYSGRAPSAASA
jgi:hypothetical protein